MLKAVEYPFINLKKVEIQTVETPAGVTYIINDYFILDDANKWKKLEVKND